MTRSNGNDENQDNAVESSLRVPEYVMLPACRRMSPGGRNGV
jgi:hypothetical protein